MYLLPSAFTPLIGANPLTELNISSGPKLLAISIFLIGTAYVVVLISLVVSGPPLQRFGQLRPRLTPTEVWRAEVLAIALEPHHGLPVSTVGAQNHQLVIGVGRAPFDQ